MSKIKPIYELVFNDEAIDGVTTISFVDNPAIEVDYKFFNAQDDNKYKFVSDEEQDKYLVTGPAMIPNSKIFRLDGFGNEYYVYFSEETIAKCVEKFFKNSLQNKTNINHKQVDVFGVTTIESWIIEDPTNDKSNALGFGGLPKGTWMVSYKVNNKQLWNKIKNGDVKGFSIEGYFVEQLIEMQEEELLFSKIENIINSTDLNDDEKYDKLKDIING